MTRRQWGVLLILALIWGSSFLLIKVGVSELSPLVVVAGRLSIGLLFLLGVTTVGRRGLPRRQIWAPLLVLALLNSALPWWLVAWGEQQINSGVAAILNATTPLFSIVLAVVVGQEEAGKGAISGLVIGFVGVVVLMGGDLLFDRGESTVAGQVAVLVASLSYAAGAVFARRTLRGESPVQLSVGQMAIASLLIVPLALLPANRPTALPSLEVLAAVGALGLLSSGVAYILFFGLLEEVGATRTVVVTYLLPVVALLLGWLFLAEHIAPQTLVGLTLILAGTGLVNQVRAGTRPLPLPVTGRSP